MSFTGNRLERLAKPKSVRDKDKLEMNSRDAPRVKDPFSRQERRKRRKERREEKERAIQRAHNAAALIAADDSDAVRARDRRSVRRD